MYRLYSDLASWYHLITPPEHHDAEAELYRDTIREKAPGARTVLELGCGGGNVASHMKADFAMTLLDIAPAMLEVSRKLNPECEHIEGDMYAARLGREFDAVLAQDALCYVSKESELRAVLATAYAHLRPGGVVVFVPDYVRETFVPSTGHGGVDAGDRSARFIAWDWDPDPTDNTYLCEYVYLLREGTSAPQSVHEQHEFGFLPMEAWRRCFVETGFELEVRSAGYGEEWKVPEAVVGSDLFVGVKPARLLESEHP